MELAVETNNLMGRTLSMEELETVAGGGEKDNELIIGFLILIAGQLLITAFSFLVAWGLAKLIHWIKTHKAAVVAAIMPFSRIAAWKYSRLSDAEIERIWTEAYRKVKG